MEKSGEGKCFVLRRRRRTKKKNKTNFAGKEKKKDNFEVFFGQFKHFHFPQFKHLKIVQNADKRSRFEQYYINSDGINVEFIDMQVHKYAC